ncbi:MAG: hypothetical protein ACOYMC_01155 [Pirellulales bacterium]
MSVRAGRTRSRLASFDVAGSAFVIRQPATGVAFTATVSPRRTASMASRSGVDRGSSREKS